MLVWMVWKKIRATKEKENSDFNLWSWNLEKNQNFEMKIRILQKVKIWSKKSHNFEIKVIILFFLYGLFILNKLQFPAEK